MSHAGEAGLKSNSRGGAGENNNNNILHHLHLRGEESNCNTTCIISGKWSWPACRCAGQVVRAAVIKVRSTRPDKNTKHCCSFIYFSCDFCESRALKNHQKIILFRKKWLKCCPNCPKKYFGVFTLNLMVTLNHIVAQQQVICIS